MPQVNIPGVGLVNFPDDLSPDQLSAAAKELYDGAALNKSMQTQGFNQPPPQEEFLSKFKNMKDLLGGVASTPAGGVMAGEAGGAALGAAFPKLGPAASGMADMAGRGMARTAGAGVSEIGNHPWLLAGGGAAVGGIPGAIGAAAFGPVLRKAGGWLTRLGTEGAEAAGSAGPKASFLSRAKPIAQTGEEATKRLVLNPQEVAQAEQMARMAKNEAQRQGMRYAAYGKIGHP